MNTLFTKQSILGKPPSSLYKPKLYSVTPLPKSKVLPMVGESNALYKPVTSNSAPTTRKLKVMQTVNVIAPRIFRTNPSKTFRVDNVVPNKPVKTSVRIKPITVSQPNCMTRSSTNELYTPYKDPEQYLEEEEVEEMAETIEQYMSKTRTDYGSGVARPKIDNKDQFELKGQFLKELRENTFSGSDNEDAKEHIEKVLKIVDLFHVPNITILDLRGAVPTKTAADAKTAIQEMAEYSQKWHNGTSRGRSTETSDGLAAIQAQLNNLGREIKKKEEGKTLEEAYYTQFGGPFQGGGYRATAPGYYQRNNANPSFQERRQSMEDTLSKFMSESAKRHEENSNLIKEIRASTDAAIRNQGASIKTLEIQIGQMSKNSTPLYKARQMTVPFPSHLDNHYCEEEGNYGPKFTEACGASHINNAIPRKEKDPGSFTLPCFINDFCFDNALVDLGASVSVMPLSTYLNLGLGELVHTRLTVELADRTVKYPKGIAENVLVGIGKFTFPVDFIILDMPEDIRVTLILGRPFLSTARAKIDVYKRKITLRVGEEKIIFKSVKPASSIIKRVYMLSLRERMELYLEARLMGEILVINRSLDPFLEDYIELIDLNKPFELRRNQGNDLMPTIEEGEVIKEFRTRNEDLETGVDDYPSYCDDDKKIHIDCAHNLKFSCMIGFEFTHANFFPLLYVNMMSRKFHNSIMKNKMVYKGSNVVGALMNVPIFVGTFSVMTDFAVLENMDAYRDEGMGDVIFGEPFLREVDTKAKRFEGMITLYKGDDEVTYQMVRSHPRFKHHTNEQCNKIPPLLKVKEKDVMNEVLRAYQKLKGFYKRVLNLGPDYIRNAKTEEWLTRGHINMHELD
ncbi:putative reverse transcriptase domain-containing protein [Tanacetum coccineum]|uniref:Reverse transcriptase domain-containing protein n=1 Tax=Tanacetum coccineum TaxID=301880 RepID=A0ABQ5BAT6_9ASTR